MTSCGLGPHPGGELNGTGGVMSMYKKSGPGSLARAASFATIVRHALGRAEASYSASFRRSKAFTTLGSALPFSSRITWPTRKPKAFSLPPL